MLHSSPRSTPKRATTPKTKHRRSLSATHTSPRHRVKTTSAQYSTQTRYPTTDNLEEHRRADETIKSLEKIQKPQRPLKIAFFGASDVTPPILDTLLEATNPNSPINLNRLYPLVDFVDVITSPPVTRLVKKQRFTQISPLAEHARTTNVHTEWYSSNPETPFRTHFELSKKYDLAVVFSFPKLIPQRLIQEFPMGMINIHPSIIPLYRGASPIQATISNNDKQSGVTIMTIEPKKFDVGRVLQQHIFDTPEGATLPTITPIITSVASDLLLDVLDSWDFYYNNSVSQNYLMDQLIAKHGQDYVTSRLHASKYGSVIPAQWAEQTAEAIDGQFRGLLGFRNIHTKLMPKINLDRDGNPKPREPIEVVLKSVQVEHTPRPADEDIVENKEDTENNNNNNNNNNINKTNDQTSTVAAKFFPHRGDPGHAVYDPQQQVIRVACKDDTVLLVHELQGQTGKVSSAKEMANGFFNKAPGGIFEGRFTM